MMYPTTFHVIEKNMGDSCWPQRGEVYGMLFISELVPLEIKIDVEEVKFSLEHHKYYLAKFQHSSADYQINRSKNKSTNKKLNEPIYKTHFLHCLKTEAFNTFTTTITQLLHCCNVIVKYTKQYYSCICRAILIWCFIWKCSIK